MSQDPGVPTEPLPGEVLPVEDPVESTRMAFGDHLEELRRCLILALIGIGLGAGVSLYFGDEILAITVRPLLVVLKLHGQRPELTALSPPETFTMYVKLALLCGLILAMPWVLYQLWKFVSAGLYRHEQRFVRLFLPVSVALFGLGVAFLYFIVLPIMLDFLVAFSPRIPLADLRPTFLEQFLLKAPTSAPASVPAPEAQRLPVYAGDPPNPETGAFWVNSLARELRIRSDGETLAVALSPTQSAAAVSSQFALQLYVSFVLSLALAFGVAFETPVLVVFLSLTGIVSAAAMTRTRRYVIFGIIVAAAVLTPPDGLSMVLLSIPMIALFEGGLLAARAIERRGA